MNASVSTTGTSTSVWPQMQSAIGHNIKQRKKGNSQKQLLPLNHSHVLF